jgi:cytochrome c oxidase assembly protein subunit 15
VRLPRLSPRQYERLTFLSLFALGFIIVTGAAVRLTGSGLGCTQWPGCEEGQFIGAMELHPMVEQINRAITGLISVIVGVAVLGSLARAPRRRDLTWLSIGLVGGVALQIVLGLYVVKFGLTPFSVTSHFLASIVLVWNAMVLHRRACQPDGASVAIVEPLVLLLGRALVALAVAVLVTGTLVTGAGPHAGDEKAPRYDFDIEAVARVHSASVWLLLLTAVVLLWRLTRTGAAAQIDRNARLLVGAILAQGALGYAQYFAGVPPYMVIFHVLGSVLVFVATLGLYLSLFTRPATNREHLDSSAAADVGSGDGRMVVS